MTPAVFQFIVGLVGITGVIGVIGVTVVEGDDGTATDVVVIGGPDWIWA
jgi:hypothetical protein